MTDRAAVLAALRARLATPTLGLPAKDVVLAPFLPPFARGAVHEIQSPHPGAGAAFAAVLLGRAGGTVVWISAGAGLAPWPPGLAQHGLTPDRLVLARAEKPVDALWAMEECLRCPVIGGVALCGPVAMDLTATRRLHLAAAAGGVIGVAVRPEDSPPLEGATASRWRVQGLSGPGSLVDPRWSLALLRARGGRPAGPWAVTWRVAQGELELDEDGTAALRRPA